MRLLHLAGNPNPEAKASSQSDVLHFRSFFGRLRLLGWGRGFRLELVLSDACLIVIEVELSRLGIELNAEKVSGVNLDYKIIPLNRQSLLTI